MSRIVVGVDGSESSRQALRWAQQEASLRSASLDVIHVYEHSLAWRSFATDDSMSATDSELVREAIEAGARHAAEDAQALVDSLVGELDGAAVDGRVIESNHPAQTLIEQSKGADLLVVGSRGRGGFASLMLGSVSQQCAAHAECPVVIIRSIPEPEA